MPRDPIWTGWIAQADGFWWGRWSVEDDAYEHRATARLPAGASLARKDWSQRQARERLSRYLSELRRVCAA